MNKICCIGHITHDKIITPHTEVDMPGGTSYYFAHAMYHLNGGKNFVLVTSLAKTDMQAVDELRSMGVEVQVIPSRHTVFFETNMVRIKTIAHSVCWPKQTLLQLKVLVKLRQASIT